MTRITRLALVGSAALLFAVTTVDAAHHEGAASADIVDTAVANGSFTTLVAAIQAAGLVETLKGPGAVHGLRADRRGVREDPEGPARRTARRQGETHEGSHLSRGTR